MTRKSSVKMMVAAALATGIALSGCTSDDNEPASPTTSEEQALTGLEGAGRSPGQQATEGAIAAVEGLHRTMDEVESRPEADLASLDRYAIDPYLKALRGDITLRRSQSIVLEGTTKILQTKPDDIKAPQDRDGNPEPGPAEVLLTTCMDVSSLKYSAPGRSEEELNQGDLPPETEAQFRVVNDSWPSPDGWRVKENLRMTQEPCGEY